MPARYLLAPWTAPADVQRAAGCVVGRDYPAPVVDHAAARTENLAAFRAALDAGSGAEAQKAGRTASKVRAKQRPRRAVRKE